MSRIVWCFLILGAAFLVLGLLLEGHSRNTLFPSAKEIIIRKDENNKVVFRFTALLDGLDKIQIGLPAILKRRPLELYLQDQKGQMAAPLVLDEEDLFRSHRTFDLERRLESTQGKTYSLCLVFPDGPALEKDVRKLQAFRGISITLCYRMSLIQVLMNYRRFKPLAHPLAISGIVFVLYFLVLLPLLRGLVDSKRGSCHRPADPLMPDPDKPAR